VAAAAAAAVINTPTIIIIPTGRVAMHVVVYASSITNNRSGGLINRARDCNEFPNLLINRS